MRIICPACSSTMSAFQVKIENDQGKCPSCNYLFVLSELLNKPPPIETFRTDRPPSGVWFERSSERTTITARATSCCGASCAGTMLLVISAVATLFFTVWIFGDGSSSMPLFCLAMGLLAEINLLYVFLRALFGKVTVVIEGDRGKVIRGLSNMGRAHKFPWNNVSDVQELLCTKNDLPVTSIVLLGPRRVEFGAELNQERRFYMLQALRTLLAERTVKTTPFKMESPFQERRPSLNLNDDGCFTCPKCEKPLLPEWISLKYDTAICVHCKQLYRLSQLTGVKLTDKTHDLSRPPKRVWIRDTGVDTRIGLTLRSPLAYLLIPFSLIFFLVFSAFLSNLVGPGQFDFFAFVFYVPFCATMLFLVGLTFRQMFGIRYISIDGDEGRLFTGVGPLGVTRRFSWSEISDMRLETCRQNVVGDHVIVLLGQTRLHFAPGVTPREANFMMYAVQELRKKRKA